MVPERRLAPREQGHLSRSPLFSPCLQGCNEESHHVLTQDCSPRCPGEEGLMREMLFSSRPHTPGSRTPVSKEPGAVLTHGRGCRSTGRGGMSRNPPACAVPFSFRSWAAHPGLPARFPAPILRLPWSMIPPPPAQSQQTGPTWKRKPGLSSCQGRGSSLLVSQRTASRQAHWAAVSLPACPGHCLGTHSGPTALTVLLKRAQGILLTRLMPRAPRMLTRGNAYALGLRRGVLPLTHHKAPFA